MTHTGRQESSLAPIYLTANCRLAVLNSFRRRLRSTEVDIRLPPRSKFRLGSEIAVSPSPKIETKGIKNGKRIIIHATDKMWNHLQLQWWKKSQKSGKIILPKVGGSACMQFLSRVVTVVHSKKHTRWHTTENWVQRCIENSPSRPWSPSPHMYSWPSSVTAALCRYPAEMHFTV